jgi:integrase/recombinase XerD
MGDFKPVVTVTTENSLFVCSFKYDPHIVQILRDFPGRCYIPEKKIWTIPAKYITQEDITKKLSIAAYVKFEKPNNYGIHDNEIQKCKQLMIRKRFSKHTIKSYLFHINRFLEQSPMTSNHAEDTVIIYINHIAGEEEKSSSYQNLAVNAIKFYIEDVCSKKMPEVVLRPKGEKKLPLVLSEQEVSSLIKSLQNIKHKTILSMIYSSGLRVSEAVHLKIEDIDLDRGIIRIEQSKGKKDRIVPLSRRVYEMYKQYSAVYKPKIWVFEGQTGGPYTIRSIQVIFHDACKKAGITKKATVHTLRHSYATHLLEKGTDIRIIQELLGHSSSKTTEIYTHVSNKLISRVVSPFDELDCV